MQRECISLQNYDRRMQKNRRNTQRGRLKKEQLGTDLITGGICFSILILVFSLILAAFMQKGKTSNAEAINPIETESPANTGKSPETEEGRAERVLAVDEIPVTGLSKDEAKRKILDRYQWDIKLSYQNTAAELKNPLPESLDMLLEEIYSQDDSLWREYYELDTASMESSIREQVASAASKWNRSPSPTQLTGRDKEKGSWIYTGGEKGILVNQEAAVREIMDLLEKKIFTATIRVQAEETAPELTVDEAKKKYQVIGTFSTAATSNSNRNNNILLATNALDGLVIFPGEEFSFNRTTGNRTTERGYLPAGAYRNGQFVEEPGGGVCQVSSTLYNAVIFSGIKTTERHPHSFEPSYVIPGEDAMVSYDGYSGPDLRFVNRQNTSVALRAVFEDRKLTISIIGMPVLEEGVEISMRSQKTKEYDPPEPGYIEDQTLQPDQEIVVQEGVKGTTWKTWLVTSKDGTVINEEYFHTSTYKGKPGIIKRNTSGVVLPEPTEPGADPETGEAAPGETALGEGGPEETVPEKTLQNEMQAAPQVQDTPGESAHSQKTPIESQSGPGLQ